MLDIPVSDIRKILYEKEALTSVLNTHLLKIKEEENRLRQNYFFIAYNVPDCYNLHHGCYHNGRRLVLQQRDCDPLIT